MLVGLGAVSTTFIAGVENVRRGRALPIGSLSQMATIRLGKRTEKRVPKIKEFVPLADLQDLRYALLGPLAEPDRRHLAERKEARTEDQGIRAARRPPGSRLYRLGPDS